MLQAQLVAACAAGDLAGAKALLGRGADPNAWVTDSDPLGEAAYCGHREVVKLLLKHGADIERRDPTGETVVDDATRGGRRDRTTLMFAHLANLARPSNPAHSSRLRQLLRRPRPCRPCCSRAR